MRARAIRWPVRFLVVLSGVLVSGPQPAWGGTGLAPDGVAHLVFADGFETGDTSVWPLQHTVWLPPGSADVTFYIELAPVDAKADLVFSMDTTGSMTGEITNLQNSLSAIASAATALVPDMNFAAASWRDFPLSTFGEPGDLPWELRQAVTATLAQVQNALNSMSAAGGNDFPEAGYEALYQLGAGTGISWGTGSVPAYTGEGLGGVGFRAGSQPLAIHITDATSHADTDYGATVPDAHSQAEAFAALGALGARVLTVLSGTDATAASQLAEIAVSTGAEVPPCAFPPVAGCAPGQCCTGINGAGEAPAGNGMCPLRFRVDINGTGLGGAIVNGLGAALKYGTRDVVAGATDPVADATDSTCFIDQIEADAFFPPPAEPAASCVPEPAPGDVGGSGYNDGFTGFATGGSAGSPGSRLRFIVHAGNDCVAAIATVQSFDVHLNVTDAATGALLDHVAVTVLVPPAP